MNYRIEAIEYYLPSKIIDNDFLEKESGIDRKFTEEKVGIKERRIALENESTSDMCVEAAKKLIEKNNIDIHDIGLVLVCTQNPDYRLPSTACIVQDKLGLERTIMAFDLNLGCSGFVYSLPVAGNFIANGSVKKALIIMADQYSKILDFKDRNTASIFGDAAAATLLSPSDEGYGVIDTDFGTDGSGSEKLIAWNTGVVKNEDKSNFVFMDGREIFAFSMKEVPISINKILRENNLKTEDIKFVIFHQANKYMINQLKKRLKLSDEQTVIFMENIGNTISATIPIALKSVMENKTLKKGDLLIFTGFGVGLSWGTILYKHV